MILRSARCSAPLYRRTLCQIISGGDGLGDFRAQGRRDPPRNEQVREDRDRRRRGGPGAGRGRGCDFDLKSLAPPALLISIEISCNEGVLSCDECEAFGIGNSRACRDDLCLRGCAI